MTDEQRDQIPDTENHERATRAVETDVAPDEAPQYGVGPFSIREVVLGGIWLVAFVVSFFPIYGVMPSGTTVWNGGIEWVLTIGVPTAAVFLIGLRRLSPDGIRRVGSLGIDQFASVAFSVSAVIWLGIIWGSFITLASNRVFLATWVVWVEFFLMLAGVLVTVFGPFIAPFDQDFVGRAEVPAHRHARPIRPISPRPAPAPAPAAEPVSPYAAAAAPDETVEAPVAEQVVVEDAAVSEPAPEVAPAAAQETVVAEQPVRHQAFWALVPDDRDVVDEVGLPVFRIGPTAWALVIEDRGEVFVIRHEDGRTGYLHDTSDVTRG